MFQLAASAKDTLPGPPARCLPRWPCFFFGTPIVCMVERFWFQEIFNQTCLRECWCSRKCCCASTMCASEVVCCPRQCSLSVGRRLVDSRTGISLTADASISFSLYKPQLVAKDCIISSVVPVLGGVATAGWPGLVDLTYTKSRHKWSATKRALEFNDFESAMDLSSTKSVDLSPGLQTSSKLSSWRAGYFAPSHSTPPWHLRLWHLLGRSMMWTWSLSCLWMRPTGLEKFILIHLACRNCWTFLHKRSDLVALTWWKD